MTINIKPARGGITLELHSSQDGRTVTSSEFVPLADVDRVIADLRLASEAVDAHETLLRVTGNGDVVTVRESTFRCDKCHRPVIASTRGDLSVPHWRHAEYVTEDGLTYPEQYSCQEGGWAEVDGSDIVPDWHNQPRSDTPIREAVA